MIVAINQVHLQQIQSHRLPHMSIANSVSENVIKSSL